MAMTMFSCVFVVGVFGLQWRLINKYYPVTGQKAGQQQILHRIIFDSLIGLPLYRQPWQFQLSAHNCSAYASPCDMAAMSLSPCPPTGISCPRAGGDVDGEPPHLPAAICMFDYGLCVNVVVDVVVVVVAVVVVYYIAICVLRPFC